MNLLEKEAIKTVLDLLRNYSTIEIQQNVSGNMRTLQIDPDKIMQVGTTLANSIESAKHPLDDAKHWLEILLKNDDK